MHRIQTARRAKIIKVLPRLIYSSLAIVIAATLFFTQTQQTSAAPGPISGTIFNDLNSNGSKDAGEGAFPNVAIVNLYNASGTYIKSRTSDATGAYSLGGLSAGTYYISLYNTARAGTLNSPPGLTKTRKEAVKKQLSLKYTH